MRRFSQRRPHIAGKPLTDHAAVGNLLKLPDHIFTLRANLTPGVMCVRQLRFIVDGHKQIYGRPDAPSEAWKLDLTGTPSALVFRHSSG